MIATLGEVGDINAEPGTRPWALAMRLKIHGELREHETSVEHARNLLQLMEQYRGYAQLENTNGKKFKDLAGFCIAKPPFGLGYSPDLIDRIQKEARAERPLIELIEEAEKVPLADPHSRPGNKNANKKNAVDDVKPVLPVGGNRADYLTKRIARDRPDILQKMKDGEFKSVRAAAKAAGIIKEKTALSTVIAAWKKLNDTERHQFKSWLEDNQ